MCPGWGNGVGVAVMIFEDRESANAANGKVVDFVQASLHDLHLGTSDIIAGEALVDIEAVIVRRCYSSSIREPRRREAAVPPGHYPVLHLRMNVADAIDDLETIS